MSLDHITLDQAIAGMLQTKVAAGKSPYTIRNYNVTFVKLRTYLAGDPPLASITTEDVTGFFVWLRDQEFDPDGCAHRGARKLSDKTLLNIHTDLSALWAWAVKKGITAENVVRAVEAPDPQPPVIVPFTKAEVTLLLDACKVKRTWKTLDPAPEARPTGERDEAIIKLLLDTGLRATELCTLRREQINQATRTISVVGKGNKARTVNYGQRAAKSLWTLLTRAPGGAPDVQDLVFVVGQGDNMRPMTRDVLRRILVRIGERAGVANVYPHRFRHTFAINYLRNDGDLLTLQALLGHSDLAMVRRYAGIAAADCARVHAKASPVDNWKL